VGSRETLSLLLWALTHNRKEMIAMLKRKIIKRFHRLRSTEQKEEFMRNNGIKFVYDKFHNMTVFADDGTLQLFPVKREV
jgi:hypothetical protein